MCTLTWRQKFNMLMAFFDLSMLTVIRIATILKTIKVMDLGQNNKDFLFNMFLAYKQPTTKTLSANLDNITTNAN